MLEQLRLIIEALPWTIPAFVAGGVLALVVFVIFPRRRTLSDRIGSALFLWCLVIALVVTLSPVKNSYFGIPSQGCNLDVWQPLNYHYWFASGSRPPNVWLLFPAGVGAMLVDGFWRRFLSVGFLVALPPGIEAVQDYYPELKRSCSSQDIVDNWTGLVMGLALGAVLMIFIGLARLVRRRFRRRREAAGVYGEASPQGDTGGELLLGGGHSGGYSDFSDFDDSPNSTRWWGQDGYGASGHAAASEYDAPYPVDHTQVMPTRSRRDDTDPDATQIISRR